MSLRQPRRIFRASLLRGSARALLLTVSFVLSVGVVVMALAGRDEGAMRSAAPGATPGEAVSAEAAQVDVVDGATLRLRAIVVRLLGVAAPDRGRACRDAGGQSVDCGAAAAAALASLVRAQPVACQVEGADGMGRALASCAVGGRDIGAWLVASGWARADDDATGIRRAALKAAEDAARAGRRGLWAWDPDASW